MLSDKLVKLPELAAALDRSEDWIKRNWLRLHNEQGMPRKIAVGWCWPRGALERWLEEGADGTIRVEPDTPAKSPGKPTAAGTLAALVANQNASLSARYAGRQA